MIQSMTGYAREESRGDWGALVLELRSVNHRYREIHFRLPEPVRGLQDTLRKQIGARIKRGKIDVALRVEQALPSGNALIVNEPLAAELVAAAESVAGYAAYTASIDPMDVLAWPGVVQERTPDSSRLSAAITELLGVALDNLVASRRDEGARLESLLRERVIGIGCHVAAIRARLPAVREQLKLKLSGLVKEMELAVDDERFNKSLANMAQKIDVAEELDRLDSHVVELERALERDEPVGRRLDFLMQEFNREANTLSSKAADTETTHAAVEMKVLIEQMREQVQNVE